MAIEVSCPACGKVLRVADSMAGKKGKCPNCQAVLEIPRQEEPPVLENAASDPPPITSRLASRYSSLVRPSGGSVKFIRDKVWWGVGLGLALCALGLILTLIFLFDGLKYGGISHMPVSAFLLMAMLLIAPFYAAIWLVLTGHLFVLLTEMRDYLKRGRE